MLYATCRARRLAYSGWQSCRPVSGRYLVGPDAPERLRSWRQSTPRSPSPHRRVSVLDRPCRPVRSKARAAWGFSVVSARHRKPRARRIRRLTHAVPEAHGERLSVMGNRRMPRSVDHRVRLADLQRTAPTSTSRDAGRRMKAKYIDTGQGALRAIASSRSIRSPPQAYMLRWPAACRHRASYYPADSTCCSRSRSKLGLCRKAGLSALLESLVKQAGFTQESFEACLKRQ